MKTVTIVCLLFLQSLSASASPRDPVAILARQMLSMVGSQSGEAGLVGYVEGSPAEKCRLSVIYSETVPLYEVRLNTEDNIYSFPISSAEKWQASIDPSSDEHTLKAEAKAKFTQSIPGMGIPLGTKFLKHRLTANVGTDGELSVEMDHRVSGFFLGDSNHVLRCRFDLATR